MNRIKSDWLLYLLLLPAAPAFLTGWFLGQSIGFTMRMYDDRKEA